MFQMKFHVLSRCCVSIVCLLFLSTTSFAEDSIAKEIQTPQTVLYADTATQVVFEKAKSFVFSFEFKEAEKLFGLCVDREPTNVDYLCWLAQTKGFLIDDLHRKGISKLSLWNQGTDIFDLYNKALKIDPTTERARIGEALRLRLTPWILGGNDTKAEQNLKQISNDYPDSIFPVHELGMLYFKDKKDAQKALECFLQVEEMTSGRELTEGERFWLPRTQYYLGNIYLNHLNQPEKALPYLQKAIQGNSNYVEFGIELTKAYMKIKQMDKAKEALTLSAEIYNENDHQLFKRDLVKLAKELKLNKDWYMSYNF